MQTIGVSMDGVLGDGVVDVVMCAERWVLVG